MHKNVLKKIAFSIAALLSSFGYGDEFFAIIGGKDGLMIPYAAVVSPAGVATEISGSAVPVGTGDIFSVAASASGLGIIGGAQGGSILPYAALVSPSGNTTPIMGLLMLSGQIFDVAINRSGTSIIGGFGFPAVPYMAFVSPSGFATQIPDGSLVMGQISTVAINDSGAAIAGGENLSTGAPYIALISSSGMVSHPSGPGSPVGNGVIDGVAINNSGVAIVSGTDQGNTEPYAALIDPSGNAMTVTGIPAGGMGHLFGAAINDSGRAIIGGHVSGGTPYAAVVSPAGVATAISGSAGPMGAGEIRSVDINNSGMAIIGGTQNGSVDPYVALVSPSGVTTALSGDLPSSVGVGLGEILSVAIGESGVALIGGSELGANFVNGYAGLVSPSGVVTRISGPGFPVDGLLRSVAIASPILEAIVPKSFGPGSSFANSVFALTSQVLPNHITHWNGEPPEQPKKNEFEEIGLLADSSDILLAPPRCMEKPTYALWANFFGEYANQQKERVIPSISNWIAGAMLAFDYLGIRNTILGAGAAYAYNYAKLGSKIGHANTNQEFFTVYGAWRADYIFIHAALWGGLYQMRNTRHSILNITSTSHVDGWLLTPHFEISSPIYTYDDDVIFEPFAMFDYANNWQGRVRERGASGFNLRMNRQYTSILRSEVGVRFYETLRYGWGNLILQEKGSYINKAPFQTGASSAFFVGSISSFTVETFSSRMQNLGAVQFNATFIPCKLKYPYGSFNYQGEFGSSFQSHLVNIEIGKYF